MTTTLLRAVLDAFKDTHNVRSLQQIAHDLDISPGMLESMIAYWVRKGQLREVAGPSSCTACGSAGHCPFVMQMPRMVEWVDPEKQDVPPPALPCRR